MPNEFSEDPAFPIIPPEGQDSQGQLESESGGPSHSYKAAIRELDDYIRRHGRPLALQETEELLGSIGSAMR